MYIFVQERNTCADRHGESWTFRVHHREDISPLVFSGVLRQHRAIITAATPAFKPWRHFLSYSSITGGLKSAPWLHFLKILPPGNKSLEGSGFSREPGGGEGNSEETRDGLPAGTNWSRHRLEQASGCAHKPVCSSAWGVISGFF